MANERTSGPIASSSPKVDVGGDNDDSLADTATSEPKHTSDDNVPTKLAEEDFKDTETGGSDKLQEPSGNPDSVVFHPDSDSVDMSTATQHSPLPNGELQPGSGQSNATTIFADDSVDKNKSDTGESKQIDSDVHPPPSGHPTECEEKN